jgi:hypothetical protein
MTQYFLVTGDMLDKANEEVIEVLFYEGEASVFVALIRCFGRSTS